MDVGFKKHRTSIAHLPVDSLCLIFEKLESKLDQQSFGLTCHNFLDIQNASCKSLKLGCSSRSSQYSMIDCVVLDNLLNRFRQLESLTLSKHISDSTLTTLQIYGSKLHSLYIENSQKITDKGLSFIASGCPLLSVISLSMCDISDNGFVSVTKSCKSLKEVNLSWCFKITDRGIWSLFQNCPQLRALNVSGCDKIVGVSFKACPPTLACLEANFCGFDSMCVSRILSGNSLEYVNLSYAQNTITGHELATIGLGFGSNLKIVNFERCNFIDDDFIMKISKGCPLLQEWNLSTCDEIGISGWELIGLYCKNLETIHVNNCLKFCDRGLLALGNGCKRLTVIYMRNCFEVTPSGISSFKKLRVGVKIKKRVAKTIIPSWAFSVIPQLKF